MENRQAQNSPDREQKISKALALVKDRLQTMELTKVLDFQAARLIREPFEALEKLMLDEQPVEVRKS